MRQSDTFVPAHQFATRTNWYTRTAAIFAVAISLASCATPVATAQEFTMRKGHAVEVCEAYLRRLNEYVYTDPPYCDRPESAAVDGFDLLRRNPLTAEEIAGFLARVRDFSQYNDQDRRAKLNDIYRARGLPVSGPPMEIDGIRSDLAAGEMRVWRYEPDIDIDNDGTTDPVVVWHGFGASPGSRRCGSYYGSTNSRSRQQQLIFLVDFASSRVYEDRTREIFQHPKFKKRDEFDPYTAIGNQLSILRFHGKYYFDAFFDPHQGDFDGNRKGIAAVRDTLGLFERSDGKTRQVCEFQWNNSGSKWGDRP
jgi:hypothetical protein